MSSEPYPMPTLRLRKADDLFSYSWDDVDYVHHPAIKAPVAV